MAQHAKEESREKITAQMGKQQCPICGAKTLTLTEAESDIPFFGKAYLFSMTCSSCKYRKADVEAAERHESCKYTLDVTSTNDLSTRVIRSADATIKLGTIGSIEPGENAEGFITNVEGVIDRMLRQVEMLKESEDDKDTVNKLINIIKKIKRVKGGNESLKIVLEDPSGNSAIISEKAVKGRMK